MVAFRSDNGQETLKINPHPDGLRIRLEDYPDFCDMQEWILTEQELDQLTDYLNELRASGSDDDGDGSVATRQKSS